MEINYKLVFFTTAALLTGLFAGSKVGAKFGYDIGYAQGRDTFTPIYEPQQTNIGGHI
ncbi:MAG: hypothetical protein RLZZ628_385 [Bacteroidota bacterium]|jgi:hypothetical protein